MSDERHVEHHPAGYAWRKRFPAAQRVQGLEGGAVYGAHADGAYWLISDQSTMADLLGSEDADLLARLVKIERFATHDEWDQAVDALRERARGM